MNRDDLERHVAAGLSKREIGELEGGVPESTVTYWLKKYGLRTERGQRHASALAGDPQPHPKLQPCARCGKPCKNHLTKHCSSVCAGATASLQRQEAWLRGEVTGLSAHGQVCTYVRNYLRDRDGYQCCECGWCKVNPVTGRSPLEVDHIDGNHYNNRPENLRLLCPNCHALTPTYRGLNRGAYNYEPEAGIEPA